jgi:CheY-like chemotaxis protein
MTMFEYFRADQRTGAVPTSAWHAENGPAGHSRADRDAKHRYRSDGYHDAGHGRVRNYRAIRDIERFRNLPIIAVTAKAMKGDRENASRAALDYIPKPVDLDQLFRWCGLAA